MNYQLFFYIKHFEPRQYLYSTRAIYTINIFIKQFLGDKPNYQKYNDVSGVMIRCYKEIERRLKLNVKDLFIEIMESYDKEINDYEDTKIIQNKDVE